MDIKKRFRDCLMIAGAGLVLTACSNDFSYDYEGESSYNNEPVDVAFTISAEDILTRADDYPNPGLADKQTLSRGSKIDMLVYAVYMMENEKAVDEETGEEYLTGKKVPKLMTQYGLGYIGNTDGEVNVDRTDANDTAEEYFKNKPACQYVDDNGEKTFIDKSMREGQTVVQVKNIFNKVDDSGNPTGKYGALKLSLRLMRNQEYTVVFWAQSSETDAYDTRNLKKIEVNYGTYNATDNVYEGALNNDETRDAFCKKETFTVTANSLVKTVVLSRPFAQINVATTGADYNMLQNGKYTFANMGYRFSKITLKGVYKYFNLVEDRTLKAGELLSDEPLTVNVDFDWAKIPAFYKYPITENGEEFPDDLVGQKKSSPQNGEDPYDLNPNEEYLYINMDTDKDYLDYKTEWPTVTFKTGTNMIETFLTETFKWLSMSYVLVPSSDTTDDTSANLSEVVFHFAEGQEENGVWDKSYNHNNNQSYQKVENVPVRRNWRTNILGGFGTGESNPNSIFNVSQALFIQEEAFDGDTEFFYQK